METHSPPIANDPAVLLARRVCYRLMALALADPKTGTFAELADPETRALARHAAELLRDEDAAVARPLALGERPLADLDPKAIFDRLPTSADELNDLYEANFGLLGGSKCPPYEIEYVPSKFTFQRSNMLADIAGFYGAFGLQTSSSNPDRPDHVSLECEFAAQLLQLEFEATKDPVFASPAQAETCQSAHQRFLKDHLAWWLPAFAKLLAHQDPGGFYEAVARFLAALVAAERALAGVEPPHQAVEPSPIENPDECSGCLLTIQ
jgi:TorA maturation chaperone TorD